jgi:hypothetical protein
VGGRELTPKSVSQTQQNGALRRRSSTLDEPLLKSMPRRISGPVRTENRGSPNSELRPESGEPPRFLNALPYDPNKPTLSNYRSISKVRGAATNRHGKINPLSRVYPLSNTAVLIGSYSVLSSGPTAALWHDRMHPVGVSSMR